MSDYTPITNFAAKDSLTTGDPAKVVKGTEISAEFAAVAAAIDTKIDDDTIVAATSKTTPVDADLVPIIDSAASNVLKKLTWANLKATLKTWIESTSFASFTTSGNVTLGDASTDTVTVNGYMGVGGAAANSSVLVRAGGAGLLGVAQRGALADFTAGTAATTRVSGFESGIGTAAFAYTVPNVSGFYAQDAVKGAGSTITNQHGVYIADQTQGTNNYGITSLVSSGANKRNLNIIGTADNYMAGNLQVDANVTLGDASTDTVTVNGYMGVGGAANAIAGLWLTNSNLTGTTQEGARFAPVGTSGATTWIRGITSAPQTAATAFTAADVASVYAGAAVKGAGSTITNAHSIYIPDQTVGTNNYGITSLVSSGTNKWNIYASGTAANYFAGQIQGALGSVGTPQYSFTGDTNTGMWSPTADTLAWSTAGTERMRIDSAGNVGIGVTPYAWSNFKALDISSYGSFASTTANALVAANGYFNGTNWIYKQTAAATYYTQNTGLHAWYTAPSGTAGNAITWTQVLAVEKDNTLALQGATSVAGVGISFPATEVLSTDANTLDAYEEGTFTPTIVGTSTAGTGTYSVQVGRYTKIGNRVNFSATITWSAHTGTGNMVVGALPFTSANVANNAPAVAVAASNLTYSGQLAANVSNNSVQVSLATFATGGALTALPIDTSATIYVAGHYEV